MRIEVWVDRSGVGRWCGLCERCGCGVKVVKGDKKNNFLVPVLLLKKIIPGNCKSV